MTAPRFYLDENVQVVIAEQLRKRGIDAVTVRDLGRLGDEDITHLTRATEMGYVLCTHDTDYIDLASEGTPHAGIVFGQHSHSIGDWVNFLELIYTVYSDEEMHNRVEYLKA